MNQSLPNIEAAVARAADFVMATWQQAVLGNTPVAGMRPLTVNIQLRQIYANSIALNTMIKGGGTISQRVIATAKIAEQLEKGSGPWDMKPMLLGGPKARMGKHGRYNIIPFRHGTSQASGSNSNFPTMPKDVYQQARQLKASLRAGKKTAWGGRTTGTEAAHPAGRNATTHEPHKAGKYEGMVRVEKTYAKATQSKYLTFRVVSDNSPAGSWIHKGYPAHRIAEAVTTYCRPAIEKMVTEAAQLDLQDTILSMGVR